MLEGKNVNLRVVEKEDLPMFMEYWNNPEFFGEFSWFPQTSKTEWEKRYDSLTPDTKWFFIEKKDGTKIGTVFHFLNGNYMEIGYILVPSERKKGYGSEAVKIIVDYLFLSKELVRVQAITGVDNFASRSLGCCLQLFLRCNVQEGNKNQRISNLDFERLGKRRARETKVYEDN